MFRNYLIIAIRNMMRHKLYSFINIGGLTMALAACLLIYLFVQNELSYDKAMPDGDRIVRMETSVGKPGPGDRPNAVSPGAINIPLTAAFPGAIETSTRMYRNEALIRRDEVRFVENIWFVDPTFFSVFDLEMAAGDRKSAFQDFRSVIISERVAKKYFGDQSAVGQVLDFNSADMLVKIVAVMKNLPKNTHLDIDFLMQLDEARHEDEPWVAQWWGASNLYTYLKLTSANQITNLKAEFPAWFDANAVPGPVIKADKKPSDSLFVDFIPFQDIHLYSTGRFQMKPSGDILVVYSFSIIAVLILVIAIINFTNLSTARASLRAKEIALRKVVGASRHQLITQFLGEALLTSTIALIFAFAIVEIALPLFSDFIEKALNLGAFRDPVVQAGLIAIVALIGLSAGAYPSLKLSAIRPARVLHSNNQATAGSLKLRAILTMLQFTIAIGLMITTAIIYSQLRYAQEIEAGFEKEDRLALQNMTYGPVEAVATTIQQEIQKLPGVKATSFSERALPLRGFWNWPVERANDQSGRALNLEPVRSDFDFLQFYGADLVAGRLYSADRRGDLPSSTTPEGDIRTQTTIINETAVRHLGFANAQDAIGEIILVPRSNGSFTDTRIVGVVRDMHLRSLRDEVDANMFTLREGPLQVLNIHIDPNGAPGTLRDIEAIWNRFAPDVPMSLGYISDGFDVFYAPDRQRAQMFMGFSLFAILISCLGLYGLAAFTAERRVKEIGVRKIMGANVLDIVKLLTFQFSKPVLMANVIAWPIAWYFANGWLQGFIYRIDLSVIYFLAAGATALAIACITVAGHAYRTANANPINALRHE